MAVTRRAGSEVSAQSSGTTTDVDLAKCPGLANGDVVVVALTMDDPASSSAWTSSDGFTILDNLATTAGKDMVTAWAYKAITNAAGEPATWEFSNTNASKFKVAVGAAYIGVDTASPIDFSTSPTSGTNDATPGGADVSSSTDGLAITVCHLAYPLIRTTSGGAPSGWSMVKWKLASNSSSSAFVAMADQARPSGGTATAGNWTNTPDDALSEWHVRALSLKNGVTVITDTGDFTPGGTEFEGDLVPVPLMTGDFTSGDSELEGVFDAGVNLSDDGVLQSGPGEFDGALVSSTRSGISGDFEPGPGEINGGITSSARQGLSGSFVDRAALSGFFSASWIIADDPPEFIEAGSPSDDLLEILKTAGEYSSVIELVSDAGEILFTSDASREQDATIWVPEASTFDLARASSVQRSLSITVPVSSDELNPLSSSHPFRNSSNVVRVWAGYRNSEGDDEMFPLATMVVSEGQVNDDGGRAVVELRCVSRLALLDEAFETHFTIEEGTNCVDAVKSIMQTSMEVDTHPIFAVTSRSTEWTLPRITAEPTDSKLDLINDILGSIGFELTDDARGRIQIGPVGETFISDGEVPVMEYGSADGIPVASGARFWSGSVPVGGVAVSGGTLGEDEDPIQVQVRDRDPQSDTYAESEQQTQMVDLSNELIRSTGQGYQAGLARLRLVGVGGGLISFTANPNPAIRPGDVISFEYEDLGFGRALYRVETMSLPLRADGSLMTVTGRGSWNPAGEDGTAAIPEPVAVPVATISDDFNRADGNLDGAGTDWEEVGWSFNIRSNRAVDLNGAHVVAWWRDSIESTNHWAEIDIDTLTSGGDVLGPAVRISGQGDGYALTGDRDGLVQLVKLVRRKPVEVLGSWDKGSTVAGSTLRLEASLDSLVGKVDGTTQITVSDGSHPGGEFVGMYARNAVGYSNESPAADNFSAGTL